MTETTQDFTVQTLLDVLSLETIDDDLFRSTCAPPGAPRLFGGQVAAQALVAATNTVDDSSRVHSLHSYFLRPGITGVPVVFRNERLHDGSTFRRRRVTAVQHGKPILSLDCSFTTDRTALEYQEPMPQRLAPEECPALEWPDTANGFNAWQPFEFRRAPAPGQSTGDLVDRFSGDLWFRLRATEGEGRPATAVLTYLSDLTLAAAVLGPTGRTDVAGMTSLDHVMWFHEPARFDDWLLYAKNSPAVGPLRGLAQGRLYTRSGALMASVAQEGLIHGTQ
ncbi:MAG: thioesterase family protein [Saccharopolyspora sp.]|uniref:acyl-CoA thioesterase n=1 Tax=Saccharopolyspora TaxID=1835 RepID=UPI001F2ECD5A|nr:MULTISPECIES: acyl-CoA thioesterase domain-containing protein [unclassified Saccharopolyspora]MBQ6643044.1 thioesterase family protein [Saccharopolyspora sp.]